MEFKKLGLLVARNNKLYFKDKMQFFVSLITPMILLVLFLTFLGKTYKDLLLSYVPVGVTLSDGLVSAFASSWLFSSILTTSCVTVAFCSNMMVVDKISKANLDFNITPVKKTTIQISYFISNFISTFIVCIAVFMLSIIYFLFVGWYFSFVDLLLILVNIFLSVLVGALISSILMLFISSQGALSAICTLISSMYGFICGAYMPISQFSSAIQHFVGFIPGTYTTVIFRNYYMQGILTELGKTLPEQAIEQIKIGFDNNYSFFNTEVSRLAMFLIIIISAIILFGLYVLIVYLQNKNHHKKQITTPKSNKAEI